MSSKCFDCYKTLPVERQFEEAVCFNCVCQRFDNSKKLKEFNLPYDLSLQLKNYIVFN